MKKLTTVHSPQWIGRIRPAHCFSVCDYECKNTDDNYLNLMETLFNGG